MSNSANNPGAFYDLDAIRALSILDVCDALSVPWECKYGKYWAKIRDERTASVLLHTDEFPNKYIDFGGTNKKSDVIQLVCEVKGMKNRGDAIVYLGDRFNLRSDRQRRPNDELSYWEYSKLGIYGDLATKNLSFDFEHETLDEISKRSQEYGMPMNTLRKKHPKVYAQILWDKAIPHIKEMRNNYYLNLLSMYHLTQKTDFSALPDVISEFQEEIKALRTAERLLIRAAEGTSIKAFPVGEYDPTQDLNKIFEGEVKPKVGNHSYSEMKDAAEEKNCEVKHRTIPWNKFSFGDLEGYAFSAFFKNADQVVVGYLSCDYAVLKPLLDKMAGEHTLGDKIAEAESKRQANMVSADRQVHYQPER